LKLLLFVGRSVDESERAHPHTCVRVGVCQTPGMSLLRSVSMRWSSFKRQSMNSWYGLGWCDQQSFWKKSCPPHLARQFPHCSTGTMPDCGTEYGVHYSTPPDRQSALMCTATICERSCRASIQHGKGVPFANV
jgi:hypothetical protein